MEVIYKLAESTSRPLEIDITSCPDGVYIRRDIKKIIAELDDGSEFNKYQYQEAFLTKSEYEIYARELLSLQLNGDDNSSAFAQYKKNLDTPIEYPVNGFTYKPKWAESIYAGLLQKGALLPQLFPLKIYDSTETEERAELMTMEELIALSIFLAQAQERFFAEYKAQKAGN